MQKKSYMQYVLLKTIFVPFNLMQRDGLYFHPDNPNRELLSWRANGEWKDAEFRGRATLEDVVLPKKEDYDRLANITFTHLSAVLSLRQRGLIPSIEECKQQLMDDTKIVTYVSSEEDMFDHQDEIELVNNFHDEVVYDNPLQMNLSTTETVKKLLVYSDDIYHCVTDPTLDQNQIDQEYRIVADKVHLVYFLGDGQPTKQAQVLMRNDPECENLKVKPINGAFHTYSKSINCVGYLYYDTHEFDIINNWRESEKQVKWITNPSDPNQSENEQAIKYNATIAAASLGFMDKLSREADEGAESVATTAADFLDYLVELSEKKPNAMAILGQMRFYENILLVREAEKEGNTDKYFSSFKFNELLFANTHAIDYISMTLELLIQKHCASPAEYKLFDYIMWRKTVNGKFISSDRSVEWSNRIVRVFLGHYYNLSTHGKFCSLLTQLNIDESKGKVTGGKPSVAAKKPSGNKIEYNRIFMETLVYLDTTRVFYIDEERVAVTKTKGFKKRTSTNNPGIGDAIPNDILTKLSSAEALNPAALFAISTAKERLRTYFDEYKIDPDKTQTKFPLPDVNKVAESNLNEAITILDADELKDANSYKNNLIKEEITRQCSSLGIDMPSLKVRIEKNGQMKTINMRRIELCRVVIKLREDRMGEIQTRMRREGGNEPHSNDVMKEWKKSAVSDYNASRNAGEDAQEVPRSLLERMKDELKETFYTLDGTNAKNVSENEMFHIRVQEAALMEEQQQERQIISPAKSYDSLGINF